MGTTPQLHKMYTGLAGEYRVASELLLRGVVVYLSKFDDGVDMMLLNGKTVQIKAAHLSYNKTNHGHCYHFILKGWVLQRNGSRTPQHSRHSDVYVFWCIEADSFYIVPVAELGERSGIDLFPASIGSSSNGKTKFPRSRSQFNVYKDRWDLLTDAQPKKTKLERGCSSPLFPISIKGEQL